MQNKTYNVTVYTPLGNKTGIAEFSIDKDNLRGTLTLLGHTQPMEGAIDAAGACRLSGSIVTIARTIPFTASGKINENDISLLLSGGHSVFRLTGTRQRDAEPARG